MTSDINNRLYQIQEGFKHPLLQPWRWCGRQWTQIRHIEEGSLCFKSAQVALKILSIIPLTLLTVLALMPAVFGAVASSSHRYSEQDLPLTEQHKKCLEELEFSDPMPMLLRENMSDKIRQLNLNYQVEIFRPRILPGEPRTTHIDLEHNNGLLQTLSSIFRAVKNHFFDKKAPPILVDLPDLIFGSPFTDEKNAELQHTLKSCHKISFQITNDLQKMSLSVGYH